MLLNPTIGTTTDSLMLSAGNLQLNPNNFTVDPWDIFASIVTPNVFEGNTINDAHKLSASISTSQHALSSSSPVISGNIYEFAVFAKANEYGYVSVGCGFTTFSGWKFASFNLFTGTVNGGNMANMAIESKGNGWYRCSARATCTNSGNTSLDVKLGDNASEVSQGQTFTGDGISGIQIWGVEYFQV